MYFVFNWRDNILVPTPSITPQYKRRSIQSFHNKLSWVFGLYVNQQDDLFGCMFTWSHKMKYRYSISIPLLCSIKCRKIYTFLNLIWEGVPFVQSPLRVILSSFRIWSASEIRDEESPPRPPLVRETYSELEPLKIVPASGKYRIWILRICIYLIDYWAQLLCLF